MHRNIRSLSCSMLVALAFVALPLVAHADVELGNVEWQTLSGTDMVQFHLQWYNPDMAAASLAVSGEVWAQPFGVFVPDEGLIGTFDVPPIPPESFFDVYFEVPMGQLPPLPEEGYSSKPTQLPQIPCPPGDHWDGNIDIMWMGPGGTGQANYHLGQIMVCPGLGTSYIHMIGGCPGVSTWTLIGVCPGWTVTLFNEDMTVAGNPLPPNWTGWIGVSASGAVPVGQVCCFGIVFTCGNQTATVKLCATACACGPVGIENGTWGGLKSLYR